MKSLLGSDSSEYLQEKNHLLDWKIPLITKFELFFNNRIFISPVLSYSSMKCCFFIVFLFYTEFILNIANTKIC